MVRDVALGFDIGTTSVKAGLLWLDADVPMEYRGHGSECGLMLLWTKRGRR